VIKRVFFSHNNLLDIFSKKMLETGYCINLQHRPNRWERICEEVKKFPDYFQLHRFNAIYNQAEPRIGCAESHLEQIKMAKKKEMAFVFVLEDDVRFIDSAHEKLGKALASVPDDWDVLLGGCYETPIGEHVTEEIYKIYYAQGTHCIFYRKSCYEKIINYDKKPSGIDDYISYLAATGDINLYHIYPPVAFQNGGYSDIKQDTFDWNNKRHALSSDYHHYEKVFKGIKEHKLDHLHQHIVKIADEYLRSQASLVLDKYRFRNQF
jgi:GR25 family glycosyltransferase involved in LPS biosynthesis